MGVSPKDVAVKMKTESLLILQPYMQRICEANRMVTSERRGPPDTQCLRSIYLASIQPQLMKKRLRGLLIDPGINWLTADHWPAGPEATFDTIDLQCGFHVDIHNNIWYFVHGSGGEVRLEWLYDIYRFSQGKPYTRAMICDVLRGSLFSIENLSLL